MNFLEYLYYESLPFAYAGLAAFSFVKADLSIILPIAGIVLAFCSYFVFHQRYLYRSAHRPLRK